MTRKRRTNKELFIDKLASISIENKSIVRQTLQKELGWNKEKYEATETELIDAKKVKLGRKPGKTILLVTRPVECKKMLKVFVSYSHVDESLKQDLMKHLTPLKQKGLVDTWHDRKILAGDDWAKSITHNLGVADIILLLVSIDFINSRYCNEIELTQAIDRHKAGKCAVIPVMLRSCIWQHTPLANLQTLPKDAQPLTTFANLDVALTGVAESIEATAIELLKER